MPRALAAAFLLPPSRMALRTSICLEVTEWPSTSSDVRPLAYGLYSLIQAMSTNGKWAELFSSVMIVVIPTFILYLFLSEKIIAGVTGGGIKE